MVKIQITTTDKLKYNILYAQCTFDFYYHIVQLFLAIPHLFIPALFIFPL